MNLYRTSIQVNGCYIYIEARTADEAARAEKVIACVLERSGLWINTTPSGTPGANPLSPPAS